VNLIDLYPTLAELCGLPAPAAQEGASLAALLKDPAAAWDRPSLTTHGKDNHAVRNERWRYIRYADGSEELYDHSQDPQEWKNLAGEAEHASVKRELAAWLPKANAENAPREKGGEDRPKKGAKGKAEAKAEAE
jgi:arylsulfatase A-like enzyme